MNRLSTALFACAGCVVAATADPMINASDAASFDFEAYPLGDVAQNPEWSVDAGSASISDGETHSGVRALALLEGSTDAEVVLPWNTTGCGSSSITFQAKDVKACDVAFSNEFINFSGAALAFVKDDTRHARVWVLVGSASSSASWQPTNLILPLDGNDTVAAWTSVGIQINFRSKRWSLRVGDLPAPGGFPLATSGVGQACHVYGYSDRTWWLDDLAFTSQGIVFGNEASVGAGARSTTADPRPDTFASFNGLTRRTRASSPHRDVSAGVRTPTPAATLSSVVYVDAGQGDDTADGSLGHPVATLHAAYTRVNPLGAEIHVAAGTYRWESKHLPRIKFISDGLVIIK